MKLNVRLFLCVGVSCLGVTEASGVPVVNEFVVNHVGTDTNEFVEIFGDPDTDYSDFTLIEVEGDSGGTGDIDDVIIPIGTSDGGGLFFSGFDPGGGTDFENGTLTLLLVEGFTGATGIDIDSDDDGIIDVSPPWTAIADSIAVSDGGAGDLTYGTTLVPNFDGDASPVGGASRIPNGLDTDAVADWIRNDMDGAGLPSFVGTLGPGEALNTPGTFNAVPEPSTLTSWGLALVLCSWWRRRYVGRIAQGTV